MAKDVIEFDWKGGKSPSAFVGKLALFDRALDNRLEAAMDDAVLMVEREAKGRAPVDTGNLRASIASEVRTDVKEAVKGVVGSGVSYAPFRNTARVKWAPSPTCSHQLTRSERKSSPGSSRPSMRRPSLRG